MVAAQHAPPVPGEGQHQVAGAAADIEHARLGTEENLPRAAHGVGAPIAVDIEGEQVVGEVVAVRHAAEHAADPARRLLFVARSIPVATHPQGRAAAHTRANRMASRTRLSSTPDTDRKSTRLNSSHLGISYAVFCL